MCRFIRQNTNRSYTYTMSCTLNTVIYSAKTASIFLPTTVILLQIVMVRGGTHLVKTMTLSPKPMSQS